MNLVNHELHTKEPTLASTWQSVAAVPLTDQLLQWPADLFALTDLMLKRTEAYRFVLSPPGGMEWPPMRFLCWSNAVEDAGRKWCEWIDDRHSSFPELLAEEWSTLREHEGTSLEHIAGGNDLRMCEALLTLHAIADEACAGLGIAISSSDGRGCLYRARGRELLARTGSLARIRPQALRVLPKVRTPRNGTSLRSFSRYVCVQGPSVEARWHKAPIRRNGTNPFSRHTNLLLLPWPLRVRESDFRPVQGSVQTLSKESFGFFEFAPSESLDLDLVDRMVLAAQDEADGVDGVLLPESAVDASEIDGLEALLYRHGVGMLVTGVRQRSPQPGRPPGNWVHVGINPRLEKGGQPTPATCEQWFHIRQNKHHPWSLDERQILQYHLGGALHPHIRWWEKMEVPRRTVHFVEHGDEIAIVSLICEDLAQIDSVAEVIRAVGPTVVFAPLLDGPQLSSRWAARYASVLADDPGSAVLTLTSYGMVQRSRPYGWDSLPVVALWKDPVRGLREIRLESGAQGVLLTLCGSDTRRRSADGRHPNDDAREYFDVAVHQVRAGRVGSTTPHSHVWPPERRLLEMDDLTILTGWVQALLEALVHAPNRVEVLLANSSPASPWRAAFQLAEPSAQLAEALYAMSLDIQTVMSQECALRLDALQTLCEEHQSGASGLKKLVRRVLRSTLFQLRSRGVPECQSARPVDPRSNGFSEADQVR